MPKKKGLCVGGEGPPVTNQKQIGGTRGVLQSWKHNPKLSEVMDLGSAEERGNDSQAGLLLRGDL